MAKLGAALSLLAGLSIAAAGPALANPANTGGSTAHVKTGAQRLSEEGFAMLAGKRVGLIANHTTLVGNRHLADLFAAASDVTLAALFAPEHGLRGTGDAGAAVRNARDPETGVPVYSLYGKTLTPTPAMLRGLDILIFDIQDIGARFYTYISTMGLAMQAAAKAGIPFMVLDRPNPLGGNYVAGFSVHRGNFSFVSRFPVPQAHGLTVGELAQMIKGERMLPGLTALKLDVVEMEGWRRYMRWPDTGLAWTPTSPAIPDFETALVYAGTGFFEATAASEGRGTDQPFRLLGARWADGAALAAELNGRGLQGVIFEASRFTPQRLPYMSAAPKLAGRELHGLRVRVTDARAFLPVETGVHVLQAFRTEARGRRAAFIDRPDWLSKLAGTSRLNGMLRKGASPKRIIAAWGRDRTAFLKRRKPYLLYR